MTWLQRVAAWGPLVIQGLAIFFVGQLVIELGYMEIGHRMLPREGLEESERRRRATMVPLVRSTFMYVAYFMTAVLILAALGFNPMPFLAGAGILGLVVGFGAQSMINDVVSGFFILIENIYLVGDIVEVGSAHGVVEAIEFRTTKIRDGEGRLHIVRNGDMKLVVNYSKDYAVAVVALEVGYDADLRAVFGCLRQVGRQFRAENDAVLAETNIEGITAFGPRSMTIRTSTRVKPGYHGAVAAAMRLLIRDAFEMEGGESPRRSLIPARWTPARAVDLQLRRAGAGAATREVRGASDDSAHSCSVWWTNDTAIEPSPTADATRLMFPPRTSPTANTPGRLVSRRWGARDRGHFAVTRSSAVRSGPVLMNPFASSATQPRSHAVFGTAPIMMNTAGRCRSRRGRRGCRAIARARAGRCLRARQSPFVCGA